MEIQGPLSISINDNTDTGIRELHLGFKPAIQQMPVTQRVQTIKEYATDLQAQSQQTDDAANQQGMLLILQVITQILPHMEADEIPMEETIIIELGESQANPIDQLLRGATLK